MKIAHGFSLIEMIVTMVLSLMLLSMILSVYQNQKQNYRYLQAVTEIQEHARFIYQMMTSDIRQAGSIGCLSLKNNAIPGGKISDFNDNYALHILKPGDSLINKVLPGSLIKRLSPQSDALLIERVSEISGLLNTVQHSKITIEKSNVYQKQEYLLISDCEHAEFFSVKNITSQGDAITLTPNQALQHTYSENGFVAKPMAILYFNANTGRINSRGIPILGFYRKNIFDSQYIPDEMLDGLAQMKLSLSPHKKVVRVVLLLTSIESIAHKVVPYIFQGKNYLAQDKRIYRTLTFDVGRRAQ